MTKTKMNLKIEHQVPGRVRMKIPAGKGNPELLKQVSETFAVIPGIEGVTVNRRPEASFCFTTPTGMTNSMTPSAVIMKRMVAPMAPSAAPTPSSTN